MTTEFGTYSKKEFSLAEISRFNGREIPNQVAIEGNVGAGKSTVASVFGQTFKFPHIGEYGNYVNFADGEKFPTFPPREELSVIDSNPLWLKLEFRRQTHMIEAVKENPKDLLLVERSPLSLVAFEYAKMRQGLPYEVTNLIGNYAMFLETGQVKEPYGYVFLNTTPSTVEKRIIERGGRSIDFLFSSRTCIQIEHFFDFFKQGYLSQQNYIDIQTDNISPKDIARRIKLFIDTFKNSGCLHSFKNFCEDTLSGLTIFEQI